MRIADFGLQNISHSDVEFIYHEGHERHEGDLSTSGLRTGSAHEEILYIFI